MYSANGSDFEQKEDYEYFMKRSQSWKNIFDWETKFMRPKKNGGWDKPFDPREVNNNFTEGNSWHYSFFVPQDIPGMIEAYGGKDKFEAKLDEMFSAESKTTGREQVDVTGLIGQYAHGNEPSHHMAYLYNYIGKPEKTNKMVHYILTEFYKNTPDGLIGNEDCGQMSAWYVLSSIGIYQVTPGQEFFNTVDAIYKNVKINLDNSNFVVIPQNVKDGYFINSELNDWVKALEHNIFDYFYIAAPVIEAKNKTFIDTLDIEIKTNGSSKTFYSIDNYPFTLYTKPFTIDKTSKINAFSLGNDNIKYHFVSSQFFKKPNNYTIDIKSTYNPQYHAGDPEGLLDGIHGTENWRKGDWQGYQTQDFEAVVDLQKTMPITTIKASFLQDQRSWILLPKQVEYYISTDNKNFELAEIVTHTIDPKLDQNIVHTFNATKKMGQARYVKVIARNFGKLPEWHVGYPYNGEAFIFIDEIIVK